MESSPVSRRIVFAVLVCALVGLGAYLIGPVAHRARTDGSPRAAASGSVAPAVSVSSPPTPTATTAGSAAPDIYQWLPFTQAGLSAAAAVVVRFGNAYGSYS